MRPALLSFALTAALVGCGSADPEPPAPAATPAGDGQADAPDPPAQPADSNATGDPEDYPEGFQPPPREAKVAFRQPTDGAVVSSPVAVAMDMDMMEVRPAGEVVDGSGHHHLIVDGAAIPVGEVVPKDATHIHYGDGSSAAQVELSLGEHTLTLQFADGAHRSFGPALSETVTVTVVPAGEAPAQAPLTDAPPPDPKLGAMAGPPDPEPLAGLLPAADLPSVRNRLAVLIDVRTPGEFAAGHAPGAINLPVGDLASKLQTLEPYRDGTVGLICKSGGRSARAAADLRKAGFVVVDFAGGTDAFVAAGHAVE